MQDTGYKIQMATYNKQLTTLDERPATVHTPAAGMKRKGSSILFINDLHQVLLFLRDDKPDISYPNMWDVPGGHVEKDETPEQCIVREMKEEMGIDLKGFLLFCIKEFDDRIEYTYWKKENLEIEEIQLTEGQCLRWFTEEEARSTALAYGFNEIVVDFFALTPP